MYIYICVCLFSIAVSYMYILPLKNQNIQCMYTCICMHVEMASCKASVNLYTRVLHQIYIPCTIAITSWKRSKHPSHVYNSEQATSSGHPFIPTNSNDPTGIQLASINSQNNQHLKNKMPFPASPAIIHMIRRSLAEVTSYPSPPSIPVISRAMKRLLTTIKKKKKTKRPNLSHPFLESPELWCLEPSYFSRLRQFKWFKSHG